MILLIKLSVGEIYSSGEHPYTPPPSIGKSNAQTCKIIETSRRVYRTDV